MTGPPLPPDIVPAKNFHKIFIIKTYPESHVKKNLINPDDVAP